MPKLPTKIALGTVSATGISTASAVTYQKLSETSFEQQVLDSRLSISDSKTNSSTNKSVVSATFTLGSGNIQRTWTCEVIGKYTPATGRDTTDEWTNARTALQAEIKGKLGVEEYKKGFVKSCSNNRKDGSRLGLKNSVVIDYEKVGETWKFREDLLNKLLGGQLEKQTQTPG